MADFLIVDETNFERDVLQSELPVILEFGAPWCAPCKRLEPILLQLAQAWDGKARFAKLDVDECIKVTMKYQVMTVPTVILFKNGAAVERLVGLQARPRLEEKFTSYL
jgi:thioredoxin 1